MLKLKTFYCDINNFGDKLNEDIFLRYLGRKIVSKKLRKAKVMGIGSLLDNCLMDSDDKCFDNRELKVFSTGFGFEEGGFFHNPKIFLPERLKRNIKCYALRGRLTKSRVEKLLGKKVNVVLGDGGLLASEFIESKNIEKLHVLGIVPHYADCKNPIFREIQKRYPNSVILDVTKPPMEFLRELASCEAVLSTAMHPLIASDSLGIPNLWARISEKTTSRYKFADYYSVYNKEKQPLDLLNFDYVNLDLVEIIKSSYDIDKNEVATIKRNLLTALANMKEDLEKESLLAKIRAIVDVLVLPYRK